MTDAIVKTLLMGLSARVHDKYPDVFNTKFSGNFHRLALTADIKVYSQSEMGDPDYHGAKGEFESWMKITYRARRKEGVGSSKLNPIRIYLAKLADSIHDRYPNALATSVHNPPILSRKFRLEIRANIVIDLKNADQNEPTIKGASHELKQFLIDEFRKRQMEIDRSIRVA